MAAFQTLPGFREFYPEDLRRRRQVFQRWRQAARNFGFSEYDAPILEPLDLYRAKSGDEIEAQLFSFVDKGEREVALRPEMTPTVCRLVGARAGALKRPIKWFNIGEFYRYERMQKGRGRSFFQFNADIFGEPGPEAEIELIALLVQCFTACGLGPEDFFVRLSDRNLWFFFLEALGLDEPRVRAMLAAIDKFEKMGDEAFKPYADAYGPLEPALKQRVLAFLNVRSLEALNRAEELIPAGAPGAALAKLVERRSDWIRLMNGLDAMGLAQFVTVDLGVVRGLAYYTGFVFEAFDRKGDLRALAGGGRYDHLVRKLGGPDLPAVGFAIGDMTFGLLLEQRGLVRETADAPDIYCILGGPGERGVAFGDIHALRAFWRVEYPLKELAFGKQFKAAAESGARLALIYGSDEVARGVVKVRDLQAREEREIPRGDGSRREQAERIVLAVRDQLQG